VSSRLNPAGTLRPSLPCRKRRRRTDPAQHSVVSYPRSVGRAQIEFEHYNPDAVAPRSSRHARRRCRWARCFLRVEDPAAAPIWPGGFLSTPGSGESRRTFARYRPRSFGLVLILVRWVIRLYGARRAHVREALSIPLTVHFSAVAARCGRRVLVCCWAAQLRRQKIGRVCRFIPAMNFNLFSQIGLVLLVGLVTKKLESSSL